MRLRKAIPSESPQTRLRSGPLARLEAPTTSPRRNSAGCEKPPALVKRSTTSSLMKNDSPSNKNRHGLGTRDTSTQHSSRKGRAMAPRNTSDDGNSAPEGSPDHETKPTAEPTATSGSLTRRWNIWGQASQSSEESARHGSDAGYWEPDLVPRDFQSGWLHWSTQRAENCGNRCQIEKADGGLELLEINLHFRSCPCGCLYPFSNSTNSAFVSPAPRMICRSVPGLMLFGPC